MRRSHLMALAAMLLLVGLMGFGPAHAVTSCSVLDGSETNAHLEDPAGDYGGAVGGSGNGLYGDINGSANDLTAVWLKKGTGASGIWGQAEIRVVNLTGLEVNESIFVLWNFEDATHPAPYKWTRYASWEVTRPGVTPIVRYTYGYLDTTPQPGGATGGTFTQEGGTSGTTTLGSPGKISINIRNSQMSSTSANSELLNFTAESRVLIGAQGAGLLPAPIDETDGGPCDTLQID